MYKKSVTDAIKAQEAKIKPSDEVIKAREKFRKAICKTCCDDGLCSSKCIK